MGEQTTFRFAAAGVAFELRGSEDFVRRHLSTLLPFVERIAGGPRGATPDHTEQRGPRASDAPGGLAAWYASHVPADTALSLQDNVLVFALWMRSFKKFVFTSDDVRRAFEDIGQPEPKSLLQILGTLKREHNLILGTEQRGEYMLNTTGIQRARRILGIAPAAAAGARRSTP